MLILVLSDAGKRLLSQLNQKSPTIAKGIRGVSHMSVAVNKMGSQLITAKSVDLRSPPRVE